MGAVDTSGSATTDSDGGATFCYVGPPLPGADTIVAYADANNNNVQDPGQATINGSGVFNFRINLQDLGKGLDTYWSWMAMTQASK